MKATGYQALIQRFSLKAFQPVASSWIHEKAGRVTERRDGRVEEYYPARYDPGDGWQAELGFALRHEGIELQILSTLFAALDPAELAAWVAQSPLGKSTRVAWYLYEWMTGKSLSLPDLDQGNYIPLIDPDAYVTLPGRRIKRQRVLDNLLGTPLWCPTVRKTPELTRCASLGLGERAAARIQAYPEPLFARAAAFLYGRETKSSFAIENLSPDARRTASFVELLRLAGRAEVHSEAALVKLQRSIVDERYAAEGFRTDQNYVGESLGPAREWIHYVPPKPEDLHAFMDAWRQVATALEDSCPDPVVAAAVEGFGFVFLHPFDDGNGRIHRFLIHHVLARRGFTPPGIVFPVSATMLKRRRDYDACLEAWSREVARFVEYRIDERGAMTVQGDSAWIYRYPDLTVQAEALYAFIQETIEIELPAELDYLAAYDAARRAMASVVDMPDRRQDLFIRLCLQGKGQLSKAKRAQFPELTDDEVERLQALILSNLKTMTECAEE